ncbi:MAG: response regulator [Deltaproteobacteria bacterium]|jgi:CheY-like chemotaxis protein|nr:MAG: response regulator [Deltaproteobacteria bacterium]
MEILLWDKENIERELIEEMLTNVGCEVTSVGDEQDCLSRLRNKQYDLVIFDQALPDLDARGFADELARINPLTPIAMMATLNIEFYEEKYGDSEIDFIITKPFDLAQLRNLVEEALVFRRKLKEAGPSSR